jgi:surfactin family lipopeptide synthetase C
VEATYVAPRTEVEERLAGIWSEVLEVERVGVYDNFFDLGGHSLLLTQLASRIRDTFKASIPLRTLFESLTIDEMTSALVAQQVENEEAQSIAEIMEEMQQLSPEELKEMLMMEGSLDNYQDLG